MEEILTLAAKHGLPVLFPTVAAIALWLKNQEILKAKDALVKEHTDFLKRLIGEAE